VNLYYADCNANALNFTLKNGHVLQGLTHFGAINIKTGQIIWETPLPVPYPGPGMLQGVTYANGVVYGGSNAFLENTPEGPNFGPNNGGHLYALDAHTGAIKLDVKLDTKSCYPPSIVNGVAYVACGYSAGLFFPPNSLYALALPQQEGGGHGGHGGGW
jgi:outer membrane protein assembly factor BamB